MKSFAARLRPALLSFLLLAGFVLIQIPLVRKADAQSPAKPTATREAVLTMQPLSLIVGKSTIIESGAAIDRVSVANPELAETLAISPHELLVNGKATGQTTLIVWRHDGVRLAFDLTVEANQSRVNAVRREIERELGDEKIDVSYSNENVFLRGTVKNLTTSDRAVAIAKTLGKTINLLKVDVPEGEPQVLLKVKFVNVDRTATAQFGVNLFSTGAGNTLGSTTTSQFSSGVIAKKGTLTVSDALNVFLFRPDLNLGATIQALESRNLLEILAEPNVLAIDGKTATFLAGGEFPFPSVQGGSSLGSVSITFRRFGVSIEFTPHITPRGTIRLQVIPEVSSLDYANSVQVSGFTIPALSTRRVQTEVELQTGQSFIIGGMLDNRETETLNRIPGISSIPYIGKLFESRTRARNHGELMVMVTPEIVKPMPAGMPTPMLDFPKEMMTDVRTDAPRTPGLDKTGLLPLDKLPAMPVEDLIEMNRRERSETPTPPQIQLLPVPVNPGTPNTPGSQTAPTPVLRTTAPSGQN